MNKFHRPTLLIACLGILLILSAACDGGTPPASEPTAAPTNSITNIPWQWTSVSNRVTEETTTVSDPASYTITFYDDGTLTGQADCNNFSGTYSQGDNFSITLGAITQAACGPDSLDQQYLSLLSSVVTGGPDGSGGLALETAGGEQRMEFQNGDASQ